MRGGYGDRCKEPEEREESGRQTRSKEANEAAWMCQARGMRDWKVCEFCCVCTPWYWFTMQFSGDVRKVS